ncbi:MAG: hypothetical protein HYZ09_02625 [Candidatus Kerfeldbacteria bacterium]|nr:hypothetical protein [Candidatus Kerfeldbacteria bacterium]
MPRLASRSRPNTLRGDLHVHSSHSACDHEVGSLFSRDTACGRSAIAEMAALTKDGGMEYFALVNHASDPARPHYADRLVNEKILYHLHEIILYNARRPHGSAAVLAGVEASVLDYGDLDVDNHILSHLDVVIVSRHGGPHQLPARITANFLKVMENPHVDILGHPTRYLDALSEANWERIMQKAVVTDTAIEFNLRIPFDERLARLAAQTGVMISLGSDTHRETRGQGIVVSKRNARARTLIRQLLAVGVKTRQILNLKPLPTLLAWLQRRT